MSQVMTDEEIIAALTRWQVRFVKVRRGGVPWREHHRPASTGDFGQMSGILNHHTGPFSSVHGMVAVLWRGRSDLPGPLCHMSTAPDGRVFLLGWNGRANHAGAGARNVRDALQNELDPPDPGPDEIDGNAILYGNEVMHPGDRSPYPDAQIEAAVRLNAAICEHHQWSANSALMHREWTTRKPDMSWHKHKSGHDFRHEVQKALRRGPQQYRFQESASVDA